MNLLSEQQICTFQNVFIINPPFNQQMGLVTRCYHDETRILDTSKEYTFKFHNQPFLQLFSTETMTKRRVPLSTKLSSRDSGLFRFVNS